MSPRYPKPNKFNVRPIQDLKLEKGEILRGFYHKNPHPPSGPETYPKMSKNAFLTSENGAFKECTRKMDKYGKKKL